MVMTFFLMIKHNQGFRHDSMCFFQIDNGKWIQSFKKVINFYCITYFLNFTNRCNNRFSIKYICYLAFCQHISFNCQRTLNSLYSIYFSQSRTIRLFQTNGIAFNLCRSFSNQINGFGAYRKRWCVHF